MRRALLSMALDDEDLQPLKSAIEARLKEYD
jgi:hypothetical protein